jgi:hypothetical protein
MPRSAAAIALFLVVAPASAIAGQLGSLASLANAPNTPQAPYRSEQEWIVSSVAAAIDGMVEDSTRTRPPSAWPHVETAPALRGRSETTFRVSLRGHVEDVAVVDHLWSPDTFVSLARHLLAAASLDHGREPSDLNARAMLTDLRVERLLDENERISRHLQQQMRSPAAHDAAALLVISFALREAWGIFADIRPALSRAAAHLAMADALRSAGVPGNDGRLAKIALSILVGRQREAMQLLTTFDTRAASDADRAWSRALRLRLTGDWRQQTPGAGDTLLERLEHARAIRTRLGADAMLDYMDTLPADDLPDWSRIGFRNEYTREARQRFNSSRLDNDARELHIVGTRLGVDASMSALNARPAPSPMVTARGGTAVQVLDWGLWAAFAQRHLCQTLMALRHDPLLKRGAWGEVEGLALFPVLRRANSATPQEISLAAPAMRQLVERSPELVTAAAWDLARQSGTGYIPSDVTWFTPAVPVGTGFDLEHRSLRPNCPRPPTRAEAATWAQQMPYDHWTVWANSWLAVDGVPPVDRTATALGPVLDYDAEALLKMLQYLPLRAEVRVRYARTLCTIAPVYCDRLGETLQLLNRDAESAAAYDEWVQRARDRVLVADGVTWVVRYYHGHGRADRAEQIARLAADTASLQGMNALGEFLERDKQTAAAERLFRATARMHDGGKPLLAAFLIRQATLTGAAIPSEADALLQRVFPRGLEPAVMYALPAQPTDGVQFATLSERAAAAGLRATDVVVAIDDWRVHGAAQYTVAARLRSDETMIFTVFRDGRYKRISAKIPERWLASRLEDFRGAR